MDPAQPVSVEQVHAVILGAVAIEASTREAAEAALRTWESDAAPGFIVSLLQIVEHNAIDEPTRLLASVIAKNAVGSSWRKTLGTREWSRVPEEEKVAVKNMTFNLLLNDSSDRIATQLGLLLSNIARFDFPGRSANLLHQLLEAAKPNNQLHVGSRIRALNSLRVVLKGLATKRFVIESGREGFQDLRQLSQQITVERELFRTRVNETFEPLHALFKYHCEAFVSLAPEWEAHAVLAKSAISAISDMLGLSPLADHLHPGTKELLELVHRTCTTISSTPSPAANLSPQQSAQWLELGGKMYERMARCVIVYLDNYSIPFGEYVPHFLSLFVEGGVISLDAETVRAMRPKRRVLLIRFIAKALLNPFYRPEWLEAPMPAGATEAQRQQVLASREKAGLAHKALNRMLSPSHEGGQCHLLVEALISKYVALTQEELGEWRSDPESYARSMDVESGPDADTPRPIGVGLLLCMLERGGEPVAQALIGLAASLQQVQPPTAEAVLMREACYRCIGEGYNHVSSHINFQSWFENELSSQLVSRLPEFLAGRQDLIASILQARALWLLGVCGQDLPMQQWCAAYQLVEKHMGSVDLVVALTAVSSAMALTALILDEQAALEQFQAASKPKAGMPNLSEVLQLRENAEAAVAQSENIGAIEDTKARVEGRLAALSDSMVDALNHCFSLLTRLHEVESMVRVLQLVSVLVEAMGDHIRPHLGIIAGALPKIWAEASSHITSSTGDRGGASQGGAAPTPGTVDTGAIVRLHSALIAVLTHLVGKLRSVAVNDMQVTSVVYPLLQHATNIGSPESECLVEEAFRLWNTTICSSSCVAQPLLHLLPNLERILRRGKDNSAAFPILESYLLLGAAAALTPISSTIQSSLLATVQQVIQAVIASTKPNQQQQQGQMPPQARGPPGRLPSSSAPAAFSPETAQEAMAASALADVMLQLFPTDVPMLLVDTFKAMAGLIAHPMVPASGVNVKVVNVMEGFLEVLGRLFILSPTALNSLLENDAEAASRFLDKWLTVASTRFLEEILGVKTMAMLGRYRRRIATVSLSAVIGADACPAVLEPSKLVRVCSLAMQTLVDNPEFHSDQEDLDALDFKSDLSEDFVLAKRLNITRADVIRNIKITDTVRGMLQKLCARLGGEEAFFSIIVSNAGSPRLVAQLKDVLQGIFNIDASSLTSDNDDLDDNDSQNDLMNSRDGSV